MDHLEFFSFHLTQLLECTIQQLIVGLEITIEMKGITYIRYYTKLKLILPLVGYNCDRIRGNIIKLHKFIGSCLIPQEMLKV